MAEKELLFRLTRKDFIVEAKRGSGKGGQNRNVTNSACRIRHPASGAEGQAQDERSYRQNEALAFQRLVASTTFKKWHKLETARQLGKLDDIEQVVEAQMKQVQVEVKRDGKWVPEDTSIEDDELGITDPNAGVEDYPANEGGSGPTF
jgi:peptide chain release factor 1